MNQNEFLCELRKKLKGLPDAEIEHAISYYMEYFSEAGEENEADIIRQLGSPSAVASKIIGEYAVNDANKQKSKGTKPIWLVILAIFASPIALPIALAISIVALVFIIVIFVLFFVFAAVGAALSLVGVVLIFTSLTLLFTSFATGIYFMGMSFFSLAVGVSLFIGAIKLSKLSGLGLQKILGNFLIRRSAS